MAGHRDRAILLRFWLALLAIHAAGCVPYASQLNLETRRGEVRVRMKRAHVTRRPPAGLTLDTIIADVPQGVVLLQATFGQAEARLCGGTLALSLGRSDELPPMAPLRVGERLRMHFPLAAQREFGRGEPTLGLLLQTPTGKRRCLSFPVLSPGETPEFEPLGRFTLGIAMGADGFTSPRGAVQQLDYVTLRLGVWLDVWHIEVAAGLGAAGCPDAHCEPTMAGSSIRRQPNIPLRIGVGRGLWERGHLSLGGRLRYQAVALDAVTFDGTTHEFMHGPQLVPYIAFTPSPRSSDGRGGARNSGFAFELPVGFAIASRTGNTITIGGALSFWGTIF